MPYFINYMDGPAHLLFSTDALETQNSGLDSQGLEVDVGPHININTGVYFVRQFPGGRAFFQKWFERKIAGPVKDRGIGHDQDGLNLLAR